MEEHISRLLSSGNKISNIVVANVTQPTSQYTTQSTDKVSYELALKTLVTYIPPTEYFPTQDPGLERLAIFNRVLNKSDFRAIEVVKEAKRRRKDLEKEEILRKKEIREAKSLELSAANALRQKHSSVSCGCLEVCTGRCSCKKNHQFCNQFCTCSCDNKLDLE